MPPNGRQPANNDADAYFAQIQRRMMETGEWDRFLTLLTVKLNEAGWLDDLRHHAKESARVMEPLSFHTLLDELRPHAQASIPAAVRQEILGIMRQYVGKQFE
ncbi:hypothetical protein JAAARDRAFT_61862 [Jaapia argillacea MUCL 33604]|uniref:Transcription and mRNA export factor SUS1 n=1 Tax=Jaapia argillacea MUCL 33604 TaxID=933084 RepID=A0A067PFE4_9AGAM|nr:hypothetical protein JAAARDRAFT_61862 [Jaapia argillacea MUCL 33604]